MDNRGKAKRIAFFNHKGGVGKTTLSTNTVFSIASLGKSVLVVDADPQSNLTSYLLPSEVVDDLLEHSDDENGRTIWSALKPIVDADGDINAVDPYEIGNVSSGSVFLIPGDVRLSGSDDFDLREGPIAKVWDMGSKEFFKSHEIETEDRTKDLYTSVHYVIGRQKRTCEIQVRTLSEDVWGAISHRVNYPVETDSLACREQMEVLAKITSCTTRQVDAIFRIYEEHERCREMETERRHSP